MRFSKYPSGTLFEVSVDNSKMFSVEDIKRYLELADRVCLDKQERAEFIRIRRSIAHTVSCPDVKIDVSDGSLIITLF